MSASAIVEAVDLVAGEASEPLSLAVGPGEIVGLLFPAARPRMSSLRVLAGLETPSRGEVRIRAPGSVAIALPGRPLAEALASRPELVLLDAANDVVDRNTWALLASERAVGTSFVVATSRIEQAYRSDRVALAWWEMSDLVRATTDLAREMTSQVQEFLAVLEEARSRSRSAALAAELRRLNAGAHALLAESRRRVRAKQEGLSVQVAAEQIAAASVNDHVLDAVIADAREG
jgi:hypothetical protein